MDLKKFRKIQFQVNRFLNIANPFVFLKITPFSVMVSFALLPFYIIFHILDAASIIIYIWLLISAFSFFSVSVILYAEAVNSILKSLLRKKGRRHYIFLTIWTTGVATLFAGAGSKVLSILFCGW